MLATIIIIIFFPTRTTSQLNTSRHALFIKHHKLLTYLPSIEPQGLASPCLILSTPYLLVRSLPLYNHVRIFLSHACSNQIHPRRPLASPLTFKKNVSRNDYFENSCSAISQTNITRASKLFLFSSIYLTFPPAATREFSNSSRLYLKSLHRLENILPFPIFIYLISSPSSNYVIVNCRKNIFNTPRQRFRKSSVSNLYKRITRYVQTKN